MVFTANGRIDGHRIEISKAALMQAPPAERLFFIVIGHIGNELMILNKLMFALSITPQGTQPEESAFSAQALFLGKLLVSKQFEAWEKIRKLYFGGKLAKDYNRLLTKKGRYSLKQLSRFYGRNGYPAAIRNNFGFHYPDQKILAELPRVKRRNDWGLYLANSNGNSLYFAADMIAGFAMLREIGNNRRRAMNRLMRDTNYVTKHLMPVINHSMFAFVDRHMPEIKIENTPTFSLTVPMLSEVGLPYFLDPSEYAQRK